jgi:adenylate kinase
VDASVDTAPLHAEQANQPEEIKRAGFVPGPVLLLGAPGVGKGTQAQAIVAAWGIPHISTGDILRENVAKQTELGRRAKLVMDRGELVSDAVVNAMVAERLERPDVERGYVLDGFPRTLPQAEWLDAWLAGGSAGGSVLSGEHLKRRVRAGASLPLVAVSLRVEYTQLLRRITGRRICPTCKRIYNIHFQPPAYDLVCDVEGTPLEQRADDVESVFVERMRAYAEQTTPVIEHYRQLGRFLEVNGDQPVFDVTAGILAAVVRFRN